LTSRLPIDERRAGPGGDASAAALEAMRHPTFYPHEPHAVEVVETHISIVFVAGERVYKVKKPLALPFLDYSTLERRLHFCEEEVRLNRRLAPDTYMGVCSIVPADGACRLGGSDEPGAVEYAVEMRRLPEDGRLDHLVRSGNVDEGAIERIAIRIADFHRDAEPAPPGYGGPADVKERLDENLRTTLPFVGTAIDSYAYAAVERFSDAFVLSHRDRLTERAASGRVREGHGDLRAEHVVLEGDRVTVFDCVEFDERLRNVDVASDLAFLYMDLERLGEPGLAKALERTYTERSGDHGLAELLPFYGCYRAWVRVKAACLRASQLAGADPRREGLIADARSHCAVALRMLWRSRLPLVVVLCGVAASGKSALAHELARMSGHTIVNSDRTRKELAGLAPEDRGGNEIYTDSFSTRTYDELARRARAKLEQGCGVLLDGTFSSRSYRRRLLEELAPTGARVLFCECRAPATVLEARSRARESKPERGSDATWPIVQRQLERFEPLDEVSARDHLVLRTDRSPAEAASELDAVVSRAIEGVSPDSSRSARSR
jgi:uncharacterized protein